MRTSLAAANFHPRQRRKIKRQATTITTSIQISFIKSKAASATPPAAQTGAEAAVLRGGGVRFGEGLVLRVPPARWQVRVGVVPALVIVVADVDLRQTGDVAAKLAAVFVDMPSIDRLQGSTNTELKDGLGL